MKQTAITKKPTVTAIITGASSGIGLAISRKLAKHNIQLSLASRNAEKLKQVYKQYFSRKLKKVIITPTDVRKRSDINRLIKATLNHFGSVDWLINCAGVSIHGEFEEICEKEWNEVIDTNLKGLILCCKAVWPIMLKKKTGQILSITSASGLRAYPTGSIYCASKFGANGFLETLMLEGQEKNIKVSVICPGQVNTSIWPKGNPIIEQARPTMLQPRFIAQLAWFVLKSPFNNHFRQIIVHPFEVQPYLRGKKRGLKKRYFKI